MWWVGWVDVGVSFFFFFFSPYYCLWLRWIWLVAVMVGGCGGFLFLFLFSLSAVVCGLGGSSWWLVASGGDGG